jgi:UDP-glucose 4-epimerase
VFNIGSGVNYSVLELASMISKNTKMIEPRIGEAYITLADNTKAKEVLGWTPTKNIEDYIQSVLH